MLEKRSVIVPLEKWEIISHMGDLGWPLGSDQNLPANHLGSRFFTLVRRWRRVMTFQNNK